MQKNLILSVTCLALLATSCSISREATCNRNVTQTEVVLAKKNFKVVGMVSGESSQNYFFGIGGLSKKSLGESAMSEMYKNANLTGSQAIINTNVCYKNQYILTPIYYGAKAIATGTVIQFVDDMDEPVSMNPNTSGPITYDYHQNEYTQKPIIINKSNSIVFTAGSIEYTGNFDSSIFTNKNGYFVLTFYKKPKNGDDIWTKEDQKTYNDTGNNVKEIAENWVNQQSTKYDYKCVLRIDR